MLIRFFKEFDLIGCGGDTQPIRLQVGTLSQSDYRCTQGVRAQGVHVQGMCTQGVCMQGMRTQGVRAQGMCVQGVCVQGWWGHSANQITGGDTQPIRLQVHTGGVHAGGAHTGDVHAGGACAGVVGTLSQSDYRWGHSANQITGAHWGCVCRGCACRGCTCRGCTCRGACTGDVRAGGVHAGVVGTLSQSDYRWGHSANQITGTCRECMRRGGGDT